MMKNKYAVRFMTMTAVCIALCVIVPTVFHFVPNAGSIFLPMHIPVLLCGMICGPSYGLLCGLIGPLLSSLLTGMPAMAVLPGMMVECAVYGSVSGLLLRHLHTGRLYADLYITLVAAMLAGRVFSGIVKALIFTPGLSMSAWITASFVTSLPGIIIQLVLLPNIVMLLMKAGVAAKLGKEEKQKA